MNNEKTKDLRKERERERESNAHMDMVAFGEEQLSQVRTVLAGDTRDQRNLRAAPTTTVSPPRSDGGCFGVALVDGQSQTRSHRTPIAGMGNQQRRHTGPGTLWARAAAAMVVCKA